MYNQADQTLLYNLALTKYPCMYARTYSVPSIFVSPNLHKIKFKKEKKLRNVFKKKINKIK